MLSLAIKMLIGNRASCIGVIFGIFLATLLISQQSAIFLGLTSRSYRLVTDISAPNLWVIDQATESDIKVRSIPEDYIDVVRSIPNVEWAVPINVIDIPILTQSGIFDLCQLYGIDNSSLIGAPTEIIEGNLRDLHQQGGVLVDVYSANGSLASRLPDGTRVPLKLGDSMEINGRRAIVVGICKITQGFYPQPLIFTINSNFKYFTSQTKVDFIAAKVKDGANQDEILQKINHYSLLSGLTRDQLKWRMAKSFLKTGILINFGLSVALGIIIGFSIAGLIFYIMTLENIQYYALIKAIGGNQNQITKMITIQVTVVGVIGYLLGTGATILWGFATRETSLAFLFPWPLFLFTSLIVVVICLFTAGLSIHKVMHVDPIVLMGA